MNIQKLGSEVKQQQHRLKELKAQSTQQQAQVTAARGRARAARLEYKKLRKAARKAKALLIKLQEELRQQQQIVTQGQKRLLKAFRKAILAEKVDQLVPGISAAAKQPTQKVFQARPVRAAASDGKGSRQPPGQGAGAVVQVAQRAEAAKRAVTGVRRQA